MMKKNIVAPITLITLVTASIITVAASKLPALNVAQSPLATPTPGGEWWEDCPSAPDCPDDWPVQPTYTPRPIPTCLPTPTCPSIGVSPTPYPTATPYPPQPTFPVAGEYPTSTPTGTPLPPTKTSTPIPEPSTPTAISPLPTPTQTSPLPTPTQGLAAQYPFDTNIKDHPAVLNATGFEAENWYEAFHYLGYKKTGWMGLYKTQVTAPELAVSGTGVFEWQNKRDTHHPMPYHLGMRDCSETFYEDTVYLRWYRRYEAGYDFSCQAKTPGLHALNPPDLDVARLAGTKPTGYDRFSARLQVWDAPGGFEPKLYVYHPNQPRNYGETLPQNIGDPLILQADRWYSFELMLKSNDVGQRNGEIKLWIDGALKAHYTGMRFRDTNNLEINELSYSAYVGGLCTAPKDQIVWDDNVVLATEYIGPMRRSQ